MSKKNIAIASMAILFYFVLVWILNLNTCLFKNISGLPCPGCGLTRAGTHLVQFQFLEAFYDHLFILPVIVLLIVVVLGKSHLISSKLWLLFTILFIGYYAIRLFLLFPNQAPMDFDSNGLIPQIFHWFLNKVLT